MPYRGPLPGVRVPPAVPAQCVPCPLSSCTPCPGMKDCEVMARPTKFRFELAASQPLVEVVDRVAVAAQVCERVKRRR